MTAQLALRLRDAALDRLETHRAELLRYVRGELKALYLDREARRGTLDAFVTADDLGRICDKLTDAGVRLPASPNWKGAAFRGKDWRAVGQHVSSQPQGHGNRILRWRFVGSR